MVQVVVGKLCSKCGQRKTLDHFESLRYRDGEPVVCGACDDCRALNRERVTASRVKHGHHFGRRPVMTFKMIQRTAVRRLVRLHDAEYQSLIEAVTTNAKAAGFTIRKAEPNHVDCWDWSEHRV